MEEEQPEVRCRVHLSRRLRIRSAIVSGVACFGHAASPSPVKLVFIALEPRPVVVANCNAHYFVVTSTSRNLLGAPALTTFVYSAMASAVM